MVLPGKVSKRCKWNIAKCEDPALRLGAVCSESALFVHICLTKNLVLITLEANLHRQVNKQYLKACLSSS